MSNKNKTENRDNEKLIKEEPSESENVEIAKEDPKKEETKSVGIVFANEVKFSLWKLIKEV